MIRRSEILTASGLIIAWYAIVLGAASPLSNGPVVDSWIYAHVTRDFITSGRIRFPGFSQAMPFVQVLFGALWAQLFGASDRSLLLSVTLLGATGAVFFYLLARRSGGNHENALLGTAIVVFNPCYLFLSFSFMTEVPFLTALLAGLLAASIAIQTRSAPLHWLAAALIVIAFLVRPFALAAIPGCALALVFDKARQSAPAAKKRSLLPGFAPYLLSLALCVLISFIVARLEPTPFLLASHFRNLASALGRLPLVVYLRGGILEPMLYLGLVLAPLAIPLGLRASLKWGFAVATILFVVAAVLVLLRTDFFGLPQLTCHGGWLRTLYLRGPNEFTWNHPLQWTILAAASLGAAGLIVSALRVRPCLSSAALPLLFTASIYWGAAIPLWLFNDRYQLPLIPAAALLLVLLPTPVSRKLRALVLVSLGALGLFSLSGVRDYQRGFDAVLEAVSQLERQGVPRANIDAGYALNGADLYPFGADPSLDPSLSDVPMVTSKSRRDFMLASRPLPGTEIIRTISVPVVFGLKTRTIYVLHRAG